MEYLLTEQEFKDLKEKENKVEEFGKCLTINYTKEEMKIYNGYNCIVGTFPKSSSTTMNFDITKFLKLFNVDFNIDIIKDIKIIDNEIVLQLKENSIKGV
jgi:hypothetical protein